MKWILPVVFLAILSSPALAAQYCATGKIEASECTGLIIKSCGYKRIDAIRSDSGEVRHIAKCFPSVSEYSKGKSQCWIRTKTSGLGLLSKAVDSVKFPDFLHENSDGDLVKVDADYLVFKCIKTAD